MYLGYTKRGVSLMTGFLLLIGMSNFLNLWIFATFTPVVWFYAFFDAWSIRNMDPAKLEQFTDDFLFFPSLTSAPAQNSLPSATAAPSASC